MECFNVCAIISPGIHAVFRIISYNCFSYFHVMWFLLLYCRSWDSVEQIQILPPFCITQGFRLLIYIMAEVRDSSSIYICTPILKACVIKCRGSCLLSLSVTHSPQRASISPHFTLVWKIGVFPHLTISNSNKDGSHHEGKLQIPHLRTPLESLGHKGSLHEEPPSHFADLPLHCLWLSYAEGTEHQCSLSQDIMTFNRTIAIIYGCFCPPQFSGTKQNYCFEGLWFCCFLCHLFPCNS